MNRSSISWVVVVLLCLVFSGVFGSVLYRNMENFFPQEFVLKVKPDTTYYAQKLHGEMFRELVAAFNMFQQGQQTQAIAMADKVFEKGLLYFDGRKPDYSDTKDRLIADRMLATASWLAGWNSNDALLSEYYANLAYVHALGLHGETYFWTINHLFDVGSRRLDQKKYKGALLAYYRIVEIYRDNPPDAFSETDRIVLAHAYAVELLIRFKRYEEAYQVANDIYPLSENETRERLRSALERLALYLNR